MRLKSGLGKGPGFFSRFPGYEFENPDIGAGLRETEKTRV